MLNDVVKQLSPKRFTKMKLKRSKMLHFWRLFTDLELLDSWTVWIDSNYTTVHMIVVMKNIFDHTFICVVLR